MIECPTCQLQHADDVRLCSRCGATLTPRLSVGWGSWCEGPDLVVRRNASPLHGACVKCGAPTDLRVKQKFSWHPPWVYLLLLPGIIVYAIAASIVHKQMTLELPVCGAHRSARRRWLAAMVAALLGMLVVPCVLLSYDLGSAALVGAAAMVVLAVVGYRQSRLATPVYIGDDLGKFRGPCPEFLKPLPQRRAA